MSFASTPDIADAVLVDNPLRAGLDQPMRDHSIERAFSTWAVLNQRLIDCVDTLSDEDLALAAGIGRWPIWAVVGHAACQRVFWLCDFAGEAGASATPFTQAAWNCPGDDDLEHVLDAPALVEALTSTFAIIEGVLARWKIADLDDVLTQPDWGDDRVHTRGAVIQRVHAHDLWHAGEVNEVLSRHGRAGIDIWK